MRFGFHFRVRLTFLLLPITLTRTERYRSLRQPPPPSTQECNDQARSGAGTHPQSLRWGSTRLPYPFRCRVESHVSTTPLCTTRFCWLPRRSTPVSRTAAVQWVTATKGSCRIFVKHQLMAWQDGRRPRREAMIHRYVNLEHVETPRITMHLFGVAWFRMLLLGFLQHHRNKST